MRRNDFVFKNQKSLFETPRIIMSPTVFESFDGRGWLLIGMENGTPRLLCAPTATAANLEWWDYAATSPRLPANADGGKVMVITRTELSRLQHALADGVEELRSSSESKVQGSELYDLSGRHVITPKKGVYIKNGKKFVNK